MDGWGFGLAPIPVPDWSLSWKRHVWPYIPPRTPLSVRTLHSRPFTLMPYAHHFSLRQSWIFPPCKCGFLHAEQVRKSSQALHLAAAMLVARVTEYMSTQCFLVKQRKYKQNADCKTALLSIYIVDSNFIPLREITGKLISGSDQTTHGELCLCMTELCHWRRWWCLQTCSRIKMFQWIGFHADGSCGPKSCNFPQPWWL